jgi:hypothetical protein
MHGTFEYHHTAARLDRGGVSVKQCITSKRFFDHVFYCCGRYLRL